MRLEDLKDPRDRDAMERAQHRPTVHDIRKRDDFAHRVSVPSPVVPDFDFKSEQEFQQSRPRADREMYITLTPKMRGIDGNDTK